MSIRVISAGLWTTIQDRGRFGYAEYGVPESGVMDRYCADFANILLQNAPDDAVMEMTLQGSELLFEDDTLFSVTGLGGDVFLDDSPIKLNSVYKVKKGQSLIIKHITRGVRLYLAVKGGFKTDEILGSRSFYKPVTLYDRLKDGNVIDTNSFDTAFIKQNAVLKFDEERYTSDIIKVYLGSEWHNLSKDIQRLLLSTPFLISNKNSRMAWLINWRKK